MNEAGAVEQDIESSNSGRALCDHVRLGYVQTKRLYAGYLGQGRFVDVCGEYLRSFSGKGFRRSASNALGRCRNQRDLIR